MRPPLRVARIEAEILIDPERRVGEIGEHTLLRHLRSRIPLDESLVVGVGDDAAVVETIGKTIVTTDALVEDVHFSLDWMPPRMLGRKAIATNVSDVAAMGGVPRHAVVSLCLPSSLEMGFVDGLYDGLLERSAEIGIAIVGGNVSATSGPLVVAVTLLGYCESPVLRSGARPGDRLVVTGYLGMAAAGLRLLSQGGRLGEEGEIESTGIWVKSSSPAVERCLKAQLDPEPPWAFARSLAEQGMVHAAIDLSDGLSGDLLALCEESGVAAVVEVASLPMHADVLAFERSRGGDPVQYALHGGEDYQLLAAVPAEQISGIVELAGVWNVHLTVIGEIVAGTPAVNVVSEGQRRALEPASFQHFADVNA